MGFFLIDGTPVAWDSVAVVILTRAIAAAMSSGVRLSADNCATASRSCEAAVEAAVAAVWDADAGSSAASDCCDAMDNAAVVGLVADCEIPGLDLPKPGKPLAVVYLSNGVILSNTGHSPVPDNMVEWLI